MKKQFLAVSALMMATPAMAVDITAGGALDSQYIFRGIPQSDEKAAGSGSIDAAWDIGFYAGTWASTVDSGTGGNDGLEYDVYGGWSGDIGDFSLGAGVTIYRYTDSFDDDYNEVNLSLGWSFLSLAVDIGEYDNFGNGDQDYQHSLLKAEYNGFFGSWGSFYDDFDGDYFSAGYGSTLTVQDQDLFDYHFTVIYSDDDLLGGSSDTNIIVGISKTFDIFSN